MKAYITKPSFDIKMQNKTKFITTVLLIAVLLFIIFFPKLKPLFSSKSGQDAVVGYTRQALNVNSFLVSPSNMVDVINSIATLLPDEEVDLAFETTGKIVAINFTEGSRVKKGDLLAKINDRPLQAQLEKLVAQKKLVEEQEFRQRSLLERDAISRESYDQISTELQTIDADINLINARIAETELRAPFDGVIGLRYVSEGSFANSSTQIARLIKMTPIKLEFAIPERYANVISSGFPITFSLDGINEKFEASVYAIDPKVDLDTRSITLRAIYPNKNEELKSGRYASVSLQLSNIENTIAVPTEAVVPEIEGEVVYLYHNGVASMTRVITGLRTESMIQITDGLKFGDTLLTSGILQLRHNLPVSIDTIITQ